MCMCVCMCVFSHIWHFFDPMDCSPPGSSVYGNSQAKILNWVAIPFSSGSSQPRDHISYISCIGRFYTTMDTCVCVCVYTRAHSCPTLHNPMDYNKQGSSVHGIFQARILGWVVIFSFSGSSWPRDWTCTSCVSCLAGEFFTAEPLGKPWEILKYLWETMILPTFYSLGLTSRSFSGFWLCPSHKNPDAIYLIWVSKCLWGCSIFIMVLIFQ